MTWFIGITYSLTCSLDESHLHTSLFIHRYNHCDYMHYIDNYMTANLTSGNPVPFRYLYLRAQQSYLALILIHC